MSNRNLLFLPFLAVLCFVMALAPAQPAAAANIVVNNVDAPGIGFNDPTPATPLGGNPGTTLGDQRLIAFQFAADLWGATLDSNVDIVVQATFQPLGCTPTSGTLGSAGTIQIFTNFPGAILPNHWYHSALANKLAGFDLTPGPPDPGLLVPPFNDDIVAFFNGAINNDPNCIGGANWYYGLDNNPGANEIDFLNVLMHELAHGLGFANFINETDGTGPLGLPDVYTAFTRDNTLGINWNVMTDAQRAFSAANTGEVVWDGPIVTAQAPNFLGNRPVMTINSPGSIAGTYQIQTAAFGAQLTTAGLTGNVVLADDGSGVVTDACEPLVNGAQVAGNIALVDRGACAFTLKALNAQAAGAVAVLIANNVAGGPAPMGGFDANVTITSVGLTLDDGNTIKGELPGVNVTLGLDPNLLAGADDNGLVRLYAPSVVALGSSISHWDTVATPNLLMEPFISADLATATTTDLTPYLLADEGWMLLDSDGDGLPNIEDACPSSDLGSTVVIDGCDSGVTNTLLADGCSITDLILACADGAGNHGAFVSCAAQVGNDLKRAGVISGRDKGQIQSCAASSSLP
ncbi:MAG: PA domain-containing protein [Acidobacteriota bacterium]|nr:PA domain-containing protein [Acidobacteriota bacterium]